MKAIFRWNAPTTQSMEIGQIGGGQTIKTYTGMMNASPLILNGTISEKNHIAGELAFITATTNNQTVSVDFASWVENASGTPIILGNVSGSPKNYEGAFLAAVNSDGTIAIAVDTSVWGNGSAPLASFLDTDFIYESWQWGLVPQKPVPKRCAQAFDFFRLFNEPIPTGKCDAGLQLGVPRTEVTWSSLLSQPVLPYNNYMPLTSVVTMYPALNSEPVLAGTITHTDEIPYTTSGNWIVSEPPTAGVSTNVASPLASDWVGVYDVSSKGFPSDSAWIDWYYTSTCSRTLGTAVANQRCVYTPPFPYNWGLLNDDPLQFRLFAGGTNARLAVGNAPEANCNNSVVDCVANSDGYRAGPNKAVQVTTGAGNFGSVGLYAVAAADSSVLKSVPFSSFVYHSSSSYWYYEGTFDMSGLNGIYNFRLFDYSGKKTFTSYPFAVNP